MLVLPSTTSNQSAVSVLSREEMVNLRETINYDDLQQMPWGQESLTQDFLHLANNNQYYRQKHRLLSQNFAQISKTDIFKKQPSVIHSINSQYTGFTDNPINDFYNYRDVLHEEDEETESEDDEYKENRMALNKLHMVYSQYFDENDDAFIADIGNFEPIV